MCTKFAYDAYKEREKNMENTKEIRKVNGKQYMTINAIAKISGIARDSLTNRFFRLKKAYPEHTCCFGSKIPVYYDEYVLYQLVRSTKTRPVRDIENMDKYKKFCKTYNSKAYADQSDFALVEMAPVDPIAKEQPEQQSASAREETLSKLIQQQNSEIAELKDKITELTTQNAQLTLSLKERNPDAKLNAKYIALQEKYLKNTERFAEKIYNMASIITEFAEHKSSGVSSSTSEYINDVFVG